MHVPINVRYIFTCVFMLIIHYSWQNSMNLDFLNVFSKNSEMSYSTKIIPLDVGLFLADRET